MAKKINYNARNFSDVRQELIEFVKQYYPDIFNDFNDASVGMMLLELNAAVGDMLSFHTDRMFQETQIDYAEERKSILSMARTFGLKVPGKRASISLVDFEVTVPVSPKGDSPDLDYAPILKRGTQVQGGGQTFETIEDIDFSSPFTSGGIPNWLILPQFDSNRNITSYKITKREIVVNGQTKIFKRVIRAEDVKPFLEVVLPDNNVLSIDSIITLEGTNYSAEPTADQFYDFDNRWFEVPALAEDKVFIEDGSRTTDDSSVKAGKFVKVDQRFLSEYTDNNFNKITFGSGSEDVTSLQSFDISSEFVKRIGDIINNTALGTTPKANTTMYIKYRVGGGANTNLGSNTISTFGLTDIRVNGANATTNFAVERSLAIAQSSLALGGRDEPTVEEIRHLVRYNFSAQNRAVVVKDYLSVIKTMDSQFGVPFRLGVYEQQNKIMIPILTLSSEGKLMNSSNSVLRENMANYLADYRMMNDYVEVADGKILNLGFEIDLFVDKEFSQAQVSSDVITSVQSYLDINKQEMGEDIFIGQLLENINNVGGVINVIDIRVYNKVGVEYSFNEVSQPYADDTTRQIDISDIYTIFGEPNAMFEVKFPDRDILVRVKTRA